jgi:hypothetical protein
MTILEQLMGKILGLETRLIIIAKDYTVLYRAVCIGEGNDICGKQAEGRNDRLPLGWILSRS